MEVPVIPEIVQPTIFEKMEHGNQKESYHFGGAITIAIEALDHIRVDQ